MLVTYDTAEWRLISDHNVEQTLDIVDRA